MGFLGRGAGGGGSGRERRKKGAETKVGLGRLETRIMGMPTVSMAKRKKAARRGRQIGRGWVRRRGAAGQWR
jgi:hypothetical protein